MEPDDVPALQRFYEANPEFFLATEGTPPASDAGREEFEGLPYSDFTYRGRWVMAFVDENGEWVAMANILGDFIADGVWHVGTFVVATSLHGTGAAQSLYRDLEAWMRGHGARWLRLGVVIGNVRGERFWEKMGYVDTRTRPYRVGERDTVLRVMMKALAGGSVPEYLALVARDRPESP